ncbi:hypothetical protein CEP51_005186, partial [Fusarium floridanum]
MESPDPISDLGLDCPFNGTFYICKDSPTRFIGCCTLNPCGTRKGLCPDEHLEPATYDSRPTVLLLAITGLPLTRHHDHATNVAPPVLTLIWNVNHMEQTGTHFDTTQNPFLNT